MNNKKTKREKNKSPIFRDISWLPKIAHALDSMEKNNGNQIRALEKGVNEPHILDDRVINKTIQAYEEAFKHCGLFGEQLNMWLALDLDPDRREEVERLIEVNQKVRAGNERILDLCEQIKQGTIDRIMETDDFELSFEALTGNRKPPFPTINEQMESLDKLSMPAPVQRFDAALAIHQFVESVLSDGGGDEDIINHGEMMTFALQFLSIKNSAQTEEMEKLVNIFSGFNRFAKIIENLLGLLHQIEKL